MPVLRTLVLKLPLQWFQFPHAILPKLGFSVEQFRSFPDERRTEWLFQNRQTHTHERPRIVPGDLLRDSPGLSICGKSDYSVKGAFSMKSTELGAESPSTYRVPMSRRLLS